VSKELWVEFTVSQEVVQIPGPTDYDTGGRNANFVLPPGPVLTVDGVTTYTPSYVYGEVYYVFINGSGWQYYAIRADISISQETFTPPDEGTDVTENKLVVHTPEINVQEAWVIGTLPQPGGDLWSPCLMWQNIDVPDDFVLQGSPPPVALPDNLNQLDSLTILGFRSISGNVINHTGIAGDVGPNDTGSGITISSYSQPSFGSGKITILQDGSYVYTPNQYFYGDDNPTTPDDFFTYTIKDSAGQISTAIDPIYITPLSYYLNNGQLDLNQAEADLAKNQPVLEKRITTDENNIDLGNAALKDLANERIMFIGMEAVGKVAEAFGPEFALLTGLIKQAFSDPSGTVDSISNISNLLELAAEDPKAGTVIKVLNQVVKPGAGAVDKVDSQLTLQDITNTQTVFQNTIAQDTADISSTQAKIDGYNNAVTSASSYLSYYEHVRDVIAGTAAP